MSTAIPRPAAAQTNARHRTWLRVLLVGLLLSVLYAALLFSTGNVHMIPAVVLLGNFLVPVTFVTFFYERRRDSQVTLPAVAGAFCWGGLLGTMLAAFVEHLLLPRAAAGVSLPQAFQVGAVEELAKLLGVLAIAWRWPRDREQDGIILGAAAGMGFAALESSGYAFGQLLGIGAKSGELSVGVAALLFVSTLRGLAAPFGHGVWTALLASVLFREQGGRAGGVRRVVGAYLAVVVLHGLWDGIGDIGALVPVSNPIARIGVMLLVFAVVALGGMLALRRRWREAAGYRAGERGRR